MRRPFIISAAFLLSGLSFLIGAEVGLRFLPVATGLPQQTLNAHDPVVRDEPNTAFTYSEGWTLAKANKGWINNDGFVNDQDYDATDSRKLLAIIGDCFIEAQMVPNGDTLEGRLAATVGAQGRVYSFAASYAGLSQYLVWAAYAAEKYKPDGIVINIVAHSFEESLTKYGPLRGRYQFAETPDGRLELRRNDFTPSRLRPIKEHSALVQYLHSNLLSVKEFISGALLKDASCPPNSCASPDRQRLADAEKVITLFLDELPNWAALPAARIVFVVDSIRPDVYTDESSGKDSYFGLMRQRFIEQARQRGYETIDLNPLFAAVHRQSGQPLDLGGDRSHWNSAGHAIVADAVRHSELFAKVFSR